MPQNTKIFLAVFLSVFFANIFTVYFSNTLFPNTTLGWEVNLIASIIASIIATISVSRKRL